VLLRRSWLGSRRPTEDSHHGARCCALLRTCRTSGRLRRSFRARHELIRSPVTHAFGFTPAISLFVECESAEELDGAFARLAEGGQQLMPLGDYGFSARFGWLTDRFGVSWQLNLA
jgi:hypothetical protein